MTESISPFMDGSLFTHLLQTAPFRKIVVVVVIDDPSEEDGLYALSLDAAGDLRIDAFASAALEPQE